MVEASPRQMYCGTACRSASYRRRKEAENERNGNARAENYHIHDGFRTKLFRVKGIGTICGICGLMPTQGLFEYMLMVKEQHLYYRNTHPYRMSKWAESAIAKSKKSVRR